jgi:hypothetical protein
LMPWSASGVFCSLKLPPSFGMTHPSLLSVAVRPNLVLEKAPVMILANLLLGALVLFVFTLVAMGFYTRRFCQYCDYCGQFYWWIGWAAMEWTSPGYECWAMRCKLCQWLTQRLQVTTRE